MKEEKFNRGRDSYTNIFLEINNPGSEEKGYDSDGLIESVTAKGIEVVIPPKKNRLVQREYDQHLYRERHLIECFINKIKHYRRVFSRFEKLSKNYLGFLSFVSALVWLR